MWANVGRSSVLVKSKKLGMKHIDEIYRVENFGKKLFITCTQRKWKGTDTSVSINHFLPKLYFYTQIEFTWLDETEILKLAWPAKAKRLRDPSRISLGGLRIRIGRWRYYIFDTSDTEVNHKILLLVYCIDAPSFGLLPATNRRHGVEIISQPILHLLFCCRYVPPIKYNFKLFLAMCHFRCPHSLFLKHQFRWSTLPLHDDLVTKHQIGDLSTCR